MLQLASKDSLGTEFFLSLGTSVCFLLRPSANWMKLTNIVGDYLFYLNSTDSMLITSKNIFTVTFRLLFDQKQGNIGTMACQVET